ncbi:hypothetical protein Pmar_PMAR021826 [Perkinsus marinus ATCC 50983]|uniref:Amino acid transporter transmembrane domain-containing protein n=2 Tax=Perkinsus marinus TaxID=31276 RepID=C5LG64_PERM5|nr:hypothetical protein Pmar_PMAR021826 [Perkinsus marinus ATCC 50983]EER04319.1 hypothetical protein Pmar_PMAR021826 [Perkinsus marinus ATCC 50983]|eukprot:XP_002772503.1 hypothetical protein Pmar_PMAR021826 [Perkinsus marinus ATCC 50983]
MGVETSPFLAPQELPSYESAAMKNLTTLEGHGYSTPLSTVFNIVNTMVGLGTASRYVYSGHLCDSGMFALPYVFGVVGYLTGSIIFIGAVLASYLSAYVLTMVLSGYLEEYSYYALATRLFKGRTMSLAIDIVLAVVLFGVISMTLVVSFDSLHSHFPKVPRWMLGGMAALAGWAASLPRSLHGVRFASYTGVGLMLLIWVSVVFTVIFNPLDSVDVEPVPLEVDTTRSWVPFSQAASAGVFSFIMHINLPCLHGELKPIDRPKMPLLMVIALAWAFVMNVSRSTYWPFHHLSCDESDLRGSSGSLLRVASNLADAHMQIAGNHWTVDIVMLSRAAACSRRPMMASVVTRRWKYTPSFERGLNPELTSGDYGDMPKPQPLIDFFTQNRNPWFGFAMFCGFNFLWWAFFGAWQIRPLWASQRKSLAEADRLYGPTKYGVGKKYIN